MSKRKLFGPGHLVILLTAAVVLGLVVKCPGKDPNAPSYKCTMAPNGVFRVCTPTESPNLGK
jgi:hypothetical protein